MDVNFVLTIVGPCLLGVILNYLHQTGSRLTRLERSIEFHEKEQGQNVLSLVNLGNKSSNQRELIQRNRDALESFFKAVIKVEEKIFLNIARQNKRIKAIEKQVFASTSKSILMLEEPDTTPILTKEIGKDTSGFMENSKIFNDESKT